MHTIFLLVRNLHVSLTRQNEINQAIRGADLNVEPGRIVAIVGESGSGKSTLGLTIGGLLSPKSIHFITGSISLDGEEILGATESRLREIRSQSNRCIFQNPASSLNPTGQKSFRQIDCWPASTVVSLCTSARRRSTPTSYSQN